MAGSSFINLINKGKVEGMKETFNFMVDGDENLYGVNVGGTIRFPLEMKGRRIRVTIETMDGRKD
jgi:hypothetical protein